MKNIFLFFLFLSLLFPFFGFCETLKLANGKVVTGKIIEKSKDFVKIDIEGIVITYYASEIKSIEDDLAAEPQVINITIKAKQKLPDSELKPIPINAMIELDFKTKNEIYELRKKEFMKFPELMINKDYSPNEEIFGQIVDEKPWWGIMGLCYFGSGEKSIVGLSEESRFLLNPFLLVGLNDLNAHVVHDSNLKPQAIYPVPVSLAWSLDRKNGYVTYDVTNFWKIAQKYHYASADSRSLELVAYNAKDMGFNYLCMDSEKSKNILAAALTNDAIKIKQFIHCGESCGYPGGCNNMSPRQEEFIFTVKQTPATLYLKLWYDKPQDCRQPENMSFIIDIK